MSKIESIIFHTFRLKFGGVPFAVDPSCWGQQRVKRYAIWRKDRGNVTIDALSNSRHSTPDPLQPPFP